MKLSEHAQGVCSRGGSVELARQQSRQSSDPNARAGQAKELATVDHHRSLIRGIHAWSTHGAFVVAARTFFGHRGLEFVQCKERFERKLQVYECGV